MVLLKWEKGFQTLPGTGLAWQRVAGLFIFGFKGSGALRQKLAIIPKPYGL